MSNLEECIRFASTNADYYSLRPGYKGMYERYSSILCFLIELQEMRKSNDDAFTTGYKKAVADINASLVKKCSEEIEKAFLEGDKKTYDFQRDYNGQFQKGGHHDS